jgi:hypothetical protein
MYGYGGFLLLLVLACCTWQMCGLVACCITSILVEGKEDLGLGIRGLIGSGFRGSLKVGLGIRD